MREFVTGAASCTVPGRGGPDDRAASPIIGVVLMVAIVVIIASVVAVFVLGFGAGKPGPTVSFEYEYDDDGTALLIHHVSGDPFESDEVTLLWGDYEATWTDVTDGLNRDVTIGDGVWVGDMHATDVDPGPVAPDDTLRIRWSSSDGDQSRILDTWEGPDA